MKEGPCFFTREDAGTEFDFERNATYYSTDQCGRYALTETAKDRLVQSELEKRAIAWELVSKTLKNPKHLTYISNDVHDFPPPGKWVKVSVDELLAAAPRTPAEMFDRALLNLTARLSHPSQTILVRPNSHWTVGGYDTESRLYILQQLIAMGYLRNVPDPQGETYVVEAKGWEKISSLTRESASSSTQAFVAMWFNEEMELFFQEGICSSLSALGYSALRIDNKEHNNKICDEIIFEIKRSRFLIADFTGNRGGVYYEAGYAHGLGKPVIWTVRGDHLSHVHFDTRQYNHIVYTDPADLRLQLTNRIRATID